MEDIVRRCSGGEISINEFELLRETERAYLIRYVSKKTMFSVDKWVPKSVGRLDGRRFKVLTNWFFEHLPYPAK